MDTDYIRASWSKLLRNSLDVALDPKVSGGMVSYLYISPKEDPTKIDALIAARRQNTENPGHLDVCVLSDDFSVTGRHGILYLPNDYVVPGGRFNEMYPWDSYWIVLGLLEDGFTKLARGMIENLVYEIRYYGGKVLNANRTYYLSRSQPPMLAAMINLVSQHLGSDERKAFVEDSCSAVAFEYRNFWKKRRFNENTGLFHYGNADQGTLGLCPEVSFGERDANGLSHYDKVLNFLRPLKMDDPLRLRFFDAKSNSLTEAAIAGDRAMRESGFDASMQMGYYGLETLDHSPICLNSLLHVQCKVLANLFASVGQQSEASFFANEARSLNQTIQERLWSQETRRFANFDDRLGKLSPFAYVTCVYPLWAKIATHEQASSFRQSLPLFETEFGLKASAEQTGCQWDAPFMWAPLVYYTVAGLNNYGFTEDARRIAEKFLATVQKVFSAEKLNYEKYNAVTGDNRTDGIIDVGYSENVTGFGWTNGLTWLLTNWLANETTLPHLVEP